MKPEIPSPQPVAVDIPSQKISLAADIVIPANAEGLVIFAHGSGSSRHSPRNRHVATILNQGFIGTVLVDLLSEEEEAVDADTGQLRFDIPLLGRRLAAITDWVLHQPRLSKLGLGYFGASTGAAAALVSAAERPRVVRAVVSRGGRPDLAGEALRKVMAPALFIVGAQDRTVLELNKQAIARLPERTVHRLEIVEGATHLFEEPGTLDRVATLARNWFQQHLAPALHL